MGDIAHTGHEPMRWTVTRVVKAGGHDWSIVDGPYCQRVEVVEAQQLEGAVDLLAALVEASAPHHDTTGVIRPDPALGAAREAAEKFINQTRGQ